MAFSYLILTLLQHWLVEELAILVGAVFDDQLDDYEQRGAESFVFIPLARLGKKGQRLFGKPAALAREKAKLPGDDWYDGAPLAR